ncbi:hypothetical protein BJ508DRAFT_340997 [Ascobolus immersus RN42]|uniref:Uncharacterized protein n=1 Tax=Ascobolus immersus RN42 TaxID=1160509 RepID=A0A3N4ICT7_ASCIM|nr:hypothetical protein BJ508DRAFT_340997 [Ascobolus immersus RN42]
MGGQTSVDDFLGNTLQRDYACRRGREDHRHIGREAIRNQCFQSGGVPISYVPSCSLIIVPAAYIVVLARVKSESGMVVVCIAISMIMDVGRTWKAADISPYLDVAEDPGAGHVRRQGVQPASRWAKDRLSGTERDLLYPVSTNEASFCEKSETCTPVSSSTLRRQGIAVNPLVARF